MIGLLVIAVLTPVLIGLPLHARSVIGYQIRHKHVAEGIPSYATKTLLTIDTGIATGRVFVHGHRATNRASAQIGA